MGTGKTIIVCSCIECPYFRGNHGVGSYCGLTEKPIKRDDAEINFEFPDFCPLD